MDSSLFLRKSACRRMAANGLGIILFRYADWLHAKGYSRNTIHLYTQAVEHFGFWRAKHHPGSQNVQPSEVAEFLHSHLSRCDCPAPAATRLQTCQSALNRLMAMLGCRNPSSQSSGEGPLGMLVADFDQHLAKVSRRVRRPGSIDGAMRGEFLEWRFESKRWDLTKLCFADFVNYVKFRAPRLKPASVGVMMTSLRALVRFLEFERMVSLGLSQAWPTVPNWKQSPPPDVLSARECRDLLQCVDCHCPSGQRDFAILLPMTDLGLRGAEIVELCLEDIDWRAGTLVIRKNKQRRERLLPLPPVVAKAILEAIHGRADPFSRVDGCFFVIGCRFPAGNGFAERFVGSCGAVARRSGDHIGYATALPPDYMRGEPHSKRWPTFWAIRISIRPPSTPE